MKKVVFFSALLLALITLTSLSVAAGDTATIDVTVTPELVSVYVNRPQIDYATVQLNQIDKSPSGDPITTVTNNGTVTENLTIKGTNATDGTNTWTLSSTSGPNQFVHKYWPEPYSAGGMEILTTSGIGLAGNLAPSGTKNIKLRMSTPTSTVTYAQYSTQMIILAVKS